MHIHKQTKNRDFSSMPAHSLHTERNRYVFDEVEQNMWICLVLKNPRKVESKKNTSKTIIKLKQIHSEYYLEGELEDSVLHTIIKTAYSTFVFFHGTFDNIVSNHNMNELRICLKMFFRYYIPTIQFHQLRFYADIYGFRFFAVDRTTYLTLQYLSNIVCSAYPALHSLCVMYHGKLIWSGMEQKDMRVLYTNNQTPNDSYMYTFMAKSTQKANKSNINLIPHELCSNSNYFRGEFLTGPLSRDFFSEHTPMIYLCSKNRFYRLICYRYEKLQLFWLMNDQSLRQPLDSTSDDLFDDIIASLDLDGDIAKQIEEQSSVESYCKSPDLGPLVVDKYQKTSVLKSLKTENYICKELQERVYFYEEFQKFIEPHASDIYQELSKHEQRLNKKQSSSQALNFRFLYFNHQNLALKSILKTNRKKLASETCRALRNIHADFELCPQTISEICAKCSDGWVVARKSHFAGRELYLLVDTSDAAQLKDLQEHFEALEDEYFSNIFLL